jgi:hypothetical protein
MHEEGLALATAGWLWNLTRRSPDDERFLEIGKALHDGTVRTDAAA